MATEKPKGTAVEKAPLTFDGLMEWVKPQIAAILPKHLTPERMVALCNLAAMKTPALKKCTPISLVNAIMQASRLGLEIGQHAHLVPFNNRRAGVTEAVMIPDYRGLIALAVRSDLVLHIDARVVYKGDEFEYVLGSKPQIRHEPQLETSRDDANVVAFYAVAHLAGGVTVFDEPMTKKQVDDVKSRSRAKDEGPWVTDYQAMGKKTVVKRLAKFLPQAPEMAAAVELDNRAETGQVGMVSDIIDTPASLSADVARKTEEQLGELREKMGNGGTGETGPKAASPAQEQEPVGASQAPGGGDAPPPPPSPDGEPF